MIRLRIEIIGKLCECDIELRDSQTMELVQNTLFCINNHLMCDSGKGQYLVGSETDNPFKNHRDGVSPGHRLYLKIIFMLNVSI